MQFNKYFQCQFVYLAIQALEEMSERGRPSYQFVTVIIPFGIFTQFISGLGQAERGNAECRARAKPSLIYVFLVFMFEDMADDIQHSPQTFWLWKFMKDQ